MPRVRSDEVEDPENHESSSASLAMGVPSDDSVVVTRRAVGPVRAVRSTLIQSSLQTLRARGLVDRYRERLQPDYVAPVFDTLAPEWLPIEVAVAHYEACELLALPEQDQLDMGNSVGQRLQGTFLQTLATTGRNLGATPWVILSQLERIWDRTFQGGGYTVHKVSPKDARIDLERIDLARIPYFRHAYCGAFLMAASMFAARAYCQPLLARCSAQRLSYKLTWV